MLGIDEKMMVVSNIMFQWLKEFLQVRLPLIKNEYRPKGGRKNC
jgi:hypothetical protein